MKTYKIIGLMNPEQARRVERRFQDALNDNAKISIDFENETITLPQAIDRHMISVISTFEHITMVDEDIFENRTHDHDHGHSHEHHHDMNEGQMAQRNIFIVFVLNLFYSIAEFIFGTVFNSRAILSDAVHDLGDALSIGIAWIFQKISNRGASETYSYGYRRFSLLGALVTSVVLIVGSILIVIDTIPLLFNPKPVHGEGVFWVAIGAIFINGFAVWLMRRGKSANEKLLNIHLLEDLFGWIAVLVMSIILRFTDWYILDPILSILIAGWILYHTLPEFYRISKIFLQAVPHDVDTNELYQMIQSIPNIHAISHFHLWSTDGRQHMMTLTVTTTSHNVKEHEAIKQQIRQLVTKYHISHVTIEVLYDPNQLINDSIMCEG